jgi:hypothetical protein
MSKLKSRRTFKGENPDLAEFFNYARLPRHTFYDRIMKKLPSFRASSLSSDVSFDFFGDDDVAGAEEGVRQLGMNTGFIDPRPR